MIDTLFGIVEFLQSGDVEELAHLDTGLQQEFDEIDAIVDQGFHHGLVQGTFLPLLAVDEDLRTGDIHAVPRQRQTQLLRGRQVSRTE